MLGILVLIRVLTKCVKGCSTPACALSTGTSATLQQTLFGSGLSEAHLLAAQHLQYVHKVENKRHGRYTHWAVEKMNSVFVGFRNSDTGLPSTTAYCRHAPGVTFKISLSFPSMVKCGASWQHNAQNVVHTPSSTQRGCQAVCEHKGLFTWFCK